MFIRASTILFSVVALAGFTTALEARDVCNEGSVQCCNSVQTSSTFISDVFYALGLPVPASGTQIGVTCSPITAGGSGSGGTCTQQTVCCNGDHISGGIVTGCSPIVVNA